MKAFAFGGRQIAAGTAVPVDLEVSILANSTRMHLPVQVIHGAQPGPCFFMSGAIHGDEIQGVEIIRQVLQALDARHLHGTVLAIPIVNSFGFLNHARYLPDRRDLNRSFPGSDRGSLASQLADLFFSQIVTRAQFGVDFHTAALHRTNLPQVRIAPHDKVLAQMADAFAPPVVMTAKLRDGSLRKAAGEVGVKVLLYEGGEALRFDDTAIDVAVKGTLRLMKHLKMIATAPDAAAHAKVVHTSSSTWLRAPEGGILRSLRRAGDKVAKSEEIGVVTGPLGETPVALISDEDGIIIGRTHLPIVNRGDALFHVARLKPMAKDSVQAVPDEDEII